MLRNTALLPLALITVLGPGVSAVKANKIVNLTTGELLFEDRGFENVPIISLENAGVIIPIPQAAIVPAPGEVSAVPNSPIAWSIEHGGTQRAILWYSAVRDQETSLAQIPASQ